MNRFLLIVVALAAIVIGVGSWKGQVQKPILSDDMQERLPAVNPSPMLQQITVFDEQGRPHTITAQPAPATALPVPAMPTVPAAPPTMISPKLPGEKAIPLPIPAGGNMYG